MKKTSKATEPKKPTKGAERRSVRISAAIRADRVVQELVERSRSEIRALFAEGCVQVEGKSCTEPGKMVRAGATVEVTFDPKRRYREKSRALKSALFQLLFEDNYLMVIDKAAGYLTMPTENSESISLIDALNRYAHVRGSRSDGVTLVHRLDRDTSGILVVAKHPNLARTLKEQFAERKPKRRYRAFVSGNVRKSSGTFRSYLATDSDLNQYSVEREGDGKLAITHYEVVQRYEDCTEVDVHLETGRRNQIRVHFAEDGTPVIGDRRYSTDIASHPLWPWPRLALHAAELGFVHPVTKKSLHFNSPLPEEFTTFRTKLSPATHTTTPLRNEQKKSPTPRKRPSKPMTRSAMRAKEKKRIR